MLFTAHGQSAAHRSTHHGGNRECFERHMKGYSQRRRSGFKFMATLHLFMPQASNQ